MAYVSTMDPRTGFMAPMGDQALGKELTASYNAASPFPHVVIDDFLPPKLLDQALHKFDEVEPIDDARTFERSQEKFKTNFQPDGLDDHLRQMFYAFNAKPFLKLMENITGIKGLIPDPYFMGAGIHEIKQGGYLSIHSDFNHHKLMNIERRINVLIYLNKDWKKEYGGGLELWDDGMTKLHQEILPAFNRCVIFNTTSNSQHGNPQPIAHPKCISRKSIALYYYTATWDGTKRSHTTQFRVRPGSNDKFDWRVKLGELSDDLLPPIIARRLRRFF
jgi:Rps23 Pro-64 3,4-dihydroxylase Tpa1-like proline 4-hydroxylase